ncbi:MAG: ABC transporter permease [Acetobacteraceae bacterium]|nr:ABC transporter permease [Acetobacteraceae bacterium]MDW8397614.1 ABC transporter permease [Acetobacteraceae bacterium]
MEWGFWLAQAVSGLAGASALFLTAAGLTLVFGVCRIVNFAHGSFAMVGAYVAVTLLPPLLAWSPSLSVFLLGAVLSALAVAALGAAVELLLLRRIYRVPELFQLLATFGLVLVIQDGVLQLWGPEDIPGPRAPGLGHGVAILGERIPAYDLFLIAVGPVVLALLTLLLRATRFGLLIQAATRDREMVAALGVNQALLFTGVFALGAFLAGLGGALQVPRIPASGGMDLPIIAEAFVVTVVGGMGSVPGAFLASVLIGLLQAFGILAFPKITLVLVFLVMAAVLMLRPQGLLGRPEPPARGAIEGLAALPPPSPPLRALAVAAILAVAFLSDDYLRKVATEMLVLAIAAFSLGFLIANAGIVSFGHAAFLGAGAYAAALLSVRAGWPMEAALAAGPLFAGTLALLFGAALARMGGIYLAMLTLAFAQITHAVAFQWVELTGGDNGIVGVRPAWWASDRASYLLLAAALVLPAIWALRRVLSAPFGVLLRAARDSEPRALALGLPVVAMRVAAFALAGALAGLGGAVFAFSRGSVDPTLLAIPQSVDLLAMLLLGGVQAVAGPLLGAVALHGLKDAVMPLTDLWRLFLGLAILLLVLAFPRGLAGAWRRA